jgi:phosphomannomutase
MTLSVHNRIADWLEGPFDEDTKEEIREMQASDPKKLEDAFYADLAFGTGGLRGLMGIGPNRMNKYTVRKATQGLANYLKKQFQNGLLSVLIGYDSRHHSKEFAEEAARVLNANNIHVFLLKDIRPTPYVSFACRYKNCHAAIMITASHNPKEYNGYKVYWQDGAQVVPPHDVGIMKEVEAITSYDQILLSSKTQASCQILDESLDKAYLEAISPLQHYPKESREQGKDLKIVFTSLHGTGITIAPKALESWGFSSITYVKDQIIPNGDFPTVKFPNPEYPEALKLGIQLLLETKSDILLATDPDADRLGVVVQHKGAPVILNGNETASLCIEYLCSVLFEQKKMPPHPAFVTTIVSSDLIPAICKHYKVHCFEVLTGFKYIGEKIHLWELQSPSYSFIFGAEESYGYLIGTHSRDKDAVVSCCLLAEMALYFKKRGMTLVDFLNRTYQKYGIFREKQASIEFAPGKEGMETMKSLMQKLRQSPLQEVCGKKVVGMEDYLESKKEDLETHQKTVLTLPKSDVLLLRLEDQSKLVIRPSGTEPKLKIYAGTRWTQFSDLVKGIQEADAHLDSLLGRMKTTLSL